MYRRKLYTVALGHIKPADRSDTVDNLAWRLHQEFPAYWVSTWTKADEHAALVVATDEPKADFEKINGWGTSYAQLCEVTS